MGSASISDSRFFVSAGQIATNASSERRRRRKTQCLHSPSRHPTDEWSIDPIVVPCCRSADNARSLVSHPHQYDHLLHTVECKRRIKLSVQRRITTFVSSRNAIPNRNHPKTRRRRRAAIVRIPPSIRMNEGHEKNSHIDSIRQPQSQE